MLVPSLANLVLVSGNETFAKPSCQQRVLFLSLFLTLPLLSTSVNNFFLHLLVNRDQGAKTTLSILPPSPVEVHPQRRPSELGSPVSSHFLMLLRRDLRLQYRYPQFFLPVMLQNFYDTFFLAFYFFYTASPHWTR